MCDPPRLSGAILSLVLFTTGMRAAAQQAGRTEAQAEQVASEITTRYVSGVSRAEWRRDASGATWRDFRGSREHPPGSSLPAHRGLWCSAATEVSGSVTREAVFYALRTERPYDCRLEQVRYVFDATAGDPFDTLAAVFARAWSGNEMTQVPMLDFSPYA